MTGIGIGFTFLNGYSKNLQVIRELSDGLEAVHETKRLRPDLILLDIGLPTLDGMSAAREICKFSKSRVIFETQESDADIVQRALALGAWGYVVKAKAATDLLGAVDAVCVGRTFVSDWIWVRNSLQHSDGERFCNSQ